MKEYEAGLGSIRDVDYRKAYNNMYIRNINLYLIWVEKTYLEVNDLIRVLLNRGADYYKFMKLC